MFSSLCAAAKTEMQKLVWSEGCLCPLPVANLTLLDSEEASRFHNHLVLNLEANAVNTVKACMLPCCKMRKFDVTHLRRGWLHLWQLLLCLRLV